VNLSRLAIARPIGTLIVFSAVILVGLSALAGLPIDLLPDISFGRLTVSTNYPGAGPEEVENLVTRVVEEAVSTVAGVRDVLSTSSDGSSRVTVTLPFGVDLDVAANDIRAALERVRRRLPDGVETPVIFKFDPSQFPIMQLGLVARDGQSTAALRQLAEEQILFRLERVPGVALADIQGGVRQQILVEMDQGRMRALGISARDVAAALAAANLAAPAGQVVEGTRELGLRALSQYRTLEQIRRTVVSTRGRVPILVADVATVREGTEEERGLVRINGRPGVLLQIQRQPGVNTVAVSNAVLREVRQINASLPGATLLLVGDNARFIRRSIASVQQALLVGGVLVVAVLFLFLRDPRSVLVIAAAVPISVVATFAVMLFFGYSLNLMTLGALALGVGMLVDSSIVVLENIFRHREMGRAGREAALEGTREVLPAVIASTLTTVVVFLPIIFLRGEALTTQLFYQFSAVVIFALLCALAVSATLTPVLASFLPALRGGGERHWTRSLVAAYRALLERALRRRAAVYLASLLVFALGLALYQFIGREVVPQADEGELFVSVELPVGTPLPTTAKTMAALERAAREAAPEIRDVTLTAGSAAFGGRTNRGFLRIRLKDRGERARSTEEVASVLRQRLRTPGGRIFVRASAGSLSVLRFGQSDPIAVEIRGFDLSEGLRLGQRVRQILEEVPGVTDASVAREELIPELTVRIDIERAAAFGLTPQQVIAALQVAVGGDVATIFRQDGREQDVVVRLREGDRRTPLDVLSLPLVTPGGEQVRLSQVAVLERDVAPASIFRKNRERVTTVTAGISGRDFGSVMQDVRSRIARLDLPPGFAVTFGEEFEEQQRANRQLIAAFLVAVGLVYAVMAVQFEELLSPLLIMGAVPFALTGSLLALFLTETTLNIQSLTGLIVLVGIVVNNAIVLVTFILARHRQEGLPLYEAVVDAAGVRLRPVLMTTATTVLGLLPVALGLGEGGELQAPLARSVLGGLLLSTLVTLVLIPTLYVSVEEFRAGVRQRRARRAERTPERRPLPVSGAGTEAAADPAVGDRR
jgi:HAE1 family hydrophobic/amphiphilic exporter-1